jgi:hypothetical protein
VLDSRGRPVDTGANAVELRGFGAAGAPDGWVARGAGTAFARFLRGVVFAAAALLGAAFLFAARFFGVAFFAARFFGVAFFAEAVFGFAFAFVAVVPE